VAWDAEGLLPDLLSRFGDFVIPVVLAHEWGHAVQGRSNFAARTVTKELQADCFAGAWSKHAQDDKVFDVSSADLNVEAMPSVFEQGGDYAVATVLATPASSSTTARIPARTTSHRAISTKASRRFSSFGVW
jgi:hypothetical protein